MTDSTAFMEKNSRRKAAKDKNKADYRQGVLNRRALTWRGAFGTEVARVYNDCALGTSAPQRIAKKGKDSYDEGSDYDEGTGTKPETPPKR